MKPPSWLNLRVRRRKDQVVIVRITVDTRAFTETLRKLDEATRAAWKP